MRQSTPQDQATASHLFDHLWASTLEPTFLLTRDFASKETIAFFFSMKEVTEAHDKFDQIKGGGGLTSVEEEGNLLRDHLVPLLVEVYEMGLKGTPLTIPDSMPCLPIPDHPPTPKARSSETT